MLHRILAALESPQPDIDTLVDLWRESRSGALGALVVQLEAGERRASLRAATVRETVSAFDAKVGAARGDERLQWLTLVPVGKVADATRQLAALENYPPDPRIADHLLGLFLAPPFRSRPTLSWWSSVVEVALKSADSGTMERLDAVLPHLSVVFSEPMAVKLVECIESARRRLPVFETDDPSLIRAVDGARTRWLRRPEVDVDALLAKALADPEDPEHLEVYADAALSVDDPRGEAIATSLALERGVRPTREPKARLKQLEKLHRGAWLGPLARVLIPSSIELRHTFLHRGVIKPKHHDEVDAVVGDPRWAPARHLEIRAVADYHDVNASGARHAVERLVVHPVLAGLRSLTGDLSPQLVREICTGETRRLEVLQADRRGRLDEDGFPYLANTDRLPHLRHLISRSFQQRLPSDWEWLLSSPLFGQLTHLELGIGLTTIAAWWTWFANARLLQKFELTDRWGHTRVRFIRGEEGVSVEAAQRYGSALGDTVDWLEGLDAHSVERFTVKWRVGASSQPSERLEERLRRVVPRVARHHSLPKSKTGGA